MLPILLRFDVAGVQFRLGSYSFLVFCGALAALLIVLRRAKEDRLSPRDLLPVFTAAVVAGFLGARAAAFAQNGTGGLVLYGGLIAGFPAGLLVARWKRLPPLAVADLAAPVVLLAAAFGRIGCVLAGCCYGVVCDGGLSYPPGSHAFKDQLRHGLIDADAAASLSTAPTVLFEAIVLFSLFLLASELWRRKPRPGSVLAVAGIGYPVWRFIAEFWRADNLPYWPGSLTFSQGISLLLIAGSAALLFRRDRPAIAAIPVFRPATVLQVILLLASPALSLGGISCGSHQERRSEGAHVYRKADATKPGQQPPEKKPLNKPDDDVADCFVSCIFECTGNCMDSCTESACEDDSDVLGPEGGPPPAPMDSVFGRLNPGASYRGSIGFEAVVNKHLSVLLKLDGKMIVGKPLLDGWRPLRLRIRSASLTIGEAVWKGSGEMDLNISPDGRIQLARSTLPAEMMAAIASLNALSGNLLQGATTETPLEDLSAVVQEELRVPELQAGFSLVTTFEGHERWVVGDAKVVEKPKGTYTLLWKVSY